MHITYIGLGKMGFNMVERLIDKGYSVSAYDPNEESRTHAEKIGAQTAPSLKDLIEQAPKPRTIWLMVPHNTVDTVLDEVAQYSSEGDTIIEGGNSPYKETMRRARHFEDLGIHFLDAGVSGGPGGARSGACIMVGGTEESFLSHEQLFKDLSQEDGYAHVGESGSGHFVKMIHNGIEYGMMQALAEGFDILNQAPFTHPLPLTKIAKLYNRGSVIESRLTGWLAHGLETHGEELDDVTGSAHASGEGLWTVETGRELNINTPVIEDALSVREETQAKPSYQGKLISVMRNEFGGHSIESK